MRNRGRGRKAGRLVRGAGDADLGHSILAIVDNGVGDLLITTAGPHGLEGGEVVLSGTTVAAYNGQALTVALDAATTFVGSGVAYTADSAGGRLRVV